MGFDRGDQAKRRSGSIEGDSEIEGLRCKNFVASQLHVDMMRSPALQLTEKPRKGRGVTGSNATDKDQATPPAAFVELRARRPADPVKPGSLDGIEFCVYRPFLCGTGMAHQRPKISDVAKLGLHDSSETGQGKRAATTGKS